MFLLDDCVFVLMGQFTFPMMENFELCLLPLRGWTDG